MGGREGLSSRCSISSQPSTVFDTSHGQAQRVVRNFLAIRRTQVEVLGRYWDMKV